MEDFAAVVRRLMDERGVSLRGLARAIHYDPSYLSKTLSGRKPVTPRLATLADEALNAGGQVQHAAASLPHGSIPSGVETAALLSRPGRRGGCYR